MLTLPRLVLVLTVLFALAPGRAFSGPTEDASALFAKWKITFDANDNVAIGKLYAEDAILHGTRSGTLTIGREASLITSRLWSAPATKCNSSNMN
jgi:hypothetical protein